MIRRVAQRVCLSLILGMCAVVIAAADEDPLSPNQFRMIQALDNYLEQFPTGENAKEFEMLKADYYIEFGQFQRGINDFARWLNRADLTQDNRAYAHERCMGATDNLKDYAQKEIWARRMAVADVPEASQRKAKDFIFLSGFQLAKAFQDTGQHLEAAQAFERLAVKNPDHEEAPQALSVAAQEYEIAGEKRRAALTFERLYYTYPDYTFPGGQPSLEALNQAAAIYFTDLGDLRHYADVVERILAADSNHEEKITFLLNLSKVYGDIKDYSNAIRIRQDFISAFPNDERSAEIRWDIIALQREAGLAEQALATLRDFVMQNPGDRRAIEALYTLADDLMDSYTSRRRDSDDRRAQGQSVMASEFAIQASEFQMSARDYFIQAYSLNDSLSNIEGHATDDHHARLSAVQVARMDSAIYAKVSFADSNTFSSDSAAKWESLTTLRDIYLKVANYGVPSTTFFSLYQRSKALEDYGHAYLNQQRPDTAITEPEIFQTITTNGLSGRYYELAVDDYQKNVIDYYEANREQVESVAEDTTYLDWVTRARQRIEGLPALRDSLQRDVISYEANLLVLTVTESLLRQIEEAWVKISSDPERQQIYQEKPYIEFAHRQSIFDQFVAPVINGRNEADTSAYIPAFGLIIRDGVQFGYDSVWVTYQQDRLRGIYGTTSRYHDRVSYMGVDAMAERARISLSQSAEFLVTDALNVPRFDASRIPPMPESPSSTPPEMPPPPAQYAGQNPTEFIPIWAKEDKDAALAYVAVLRGFGNKIKRWKRSLNNYRRASQRRKDTIERLKEEQAESGRQFIETLKLRNVEFRDEVGLNHRYRAAAENVVSHARDSYKHDIAFGDSVGYAETQRRAVRDSALEYSANSSAAFDSVRGQVEELFNHYKSQADTMSEAAGIGFTMVNNLVQAFSAFEDSFAASSMRGYQYIYDGKDSLFNVGIEHPHVLRAIERLKALDPTFLVQTIAKTYTISTEDTSGIWRVSSRAPRNDSWREPTFDDSLWAVASMGRMITVDSLQSQFTAPGVRPIWDASGTDTIFIRGNIQIPPGWGSLPEELIGPEQPKPVVNSIILRITADDDYRVFLNGNPTTAMQNPSGRVDWPRVSRFELLKDQMFSGDSLNTIAIIARNETRINRSPNSDPSTYGLMAELVIETEIPFDAYRELYKPPVEEIVYECSLTLADSSMMADTLVFPTPSDVAMYSDCRCRELEAFWTDSLKVLPKLALFRSEAARLDSELVELRREVDQLVEAALPPEPEPVPSPPAQAPSAGDSEGSAPENSETDQAAEPETNNEGGAETSSDGAEPQAGDTPDEGALEETTPGETADDESAADETSSDESGDAEADTESQPASEGEPEASGDAGDADEQPSAEEAPSAGDSEGSAPENSETDQAAEPETNNEGGTE